MTIYRDGIFETLDGPVEISYTREGHLVESYKSGGQQRHFVTLVGTHWCAHGDTVADAIADALWKDPKNRPSLESLRDDIVAAGKERLITLNEFRVLTGACMAGCRAALREKGLKAEAMTAFDVRDKVNQEWGNKLLDILGWAHAS